MKPRPRLACTIAFVALCGLVARDATTLPDPAPTQSGLLAAIDPDTGLLTAPTPEQSRALRSEIPSKSEPVVFTQRADGTVIGTLDTSFLNYTVAHIDSAGQLHTECTTEAPEQ